MRGSNNAGAAYTVSGESEAAAPTAKDLQLEQKAHAETKKELERMKEELKSTKEELESIKKELESTKKEPESAKKELQPVRVQDRVPEKTSENATKELVATKRGRLVLFEAAARDSRHLSVLSWNMVVATPDKHSVSVADFPNKVLESLSALEDVPTFDAMCTQQTKVRSFPKERLTAVVRSDGAPPECIYVPAAGAPCATPLKVTNMPCPAPNSAPWTANDKSRFKELKSRLALCSITRTEQKWVLVSYHGPYVRAGNNEARENTKLIGRLTDAWYNQYGCPIIVCGSFNDAATTADLPVSVHHVHPRTTVRYGQDALMDAPATDGPFLGDTMLYIGCNVVPETVEGLNPARLAEDHLIQTKKGEQVERAGRVHLVLGASFFVA